jgi:hypothetical protein
MSRIQVTIADKKARKPYSYSLKLKADSEDVIASVHKLLTEKNPGRTVRLNWDTNGQLQQFPKAV